MPALYSPSFGAAALPTPETLLEVCYPGSMSPHYRVQALSLDRLRKQGQVVRLIAYRHVPSAA